MNPFKEKSKKPEDYLDSIDNLFPKPYDKNSTSPYTKTRIILACGAEYEANWHSHQMLRNIADLDIRRNISLVRFLEKQQQQYLAQLKPADESILETTIAYEQLAVDLTAEMARKEKNFNVKKALDFALLEDFDHLYRYADLLDSDYGIHAERLVGKYTELTPGRPTVAHHRHPIDNVKGSINAKNNDIRTVLNTMIYQRSGQTPLRGNLSRGRGTRYAIRFAYRHFIRLVRVLSSSRIRRMFRLLVELYDRDGRTLQEDLGVQFRKRTFTPSRGG